MRKLIVFSFLLLASIFIKAQDVSLFPQSFITPPSASQDGSANLNYPIILPEGLNGVTPAVSIHYNSDAGNSWMGIGWNIGIPAVYLDTRWGVPRFDPSKETELYSLYGEQLMYPDEFLPHRHKVIQGENGPLYSTEGQERSAFLMGNEESAIKIFHPRRKETYAKIERIGNSPANYYWKVTNMDGSISWFGGDENGLDNAYVTKSDNNIAFWGLKKRVDTHGYFIKYEYQPGATPTGNLAGGTHMYLKKISYTGLQKMNGSTVQILKQPMYEVVFELDGGTRQDKSISARYGYKDVIVNRLNQIKVNELFNGTNLIRKYVFTYATGAFGKSTLKNIDEYKENPKPIFSHELEYHDAPKVTGNDGVFKSKTISAPQISTNMLLGLDDILNISRLGTTENSGIGGEVNGSLGAGISWQNMAPGGTFVNIPLYDLKANFTSGKVTLIDINGDGLQDILYKDSGGNLKFYENTCADCKKDFKLIFDPGINVTYSSSPKILEGVNHFLKGEGTQRAGLINGLWGFSMEYLFARFGVRNYKSKSMVSHYLTDANGDLLPDFVVKQDDNSVVYFNHLDSQGRPTFTTSSKPSENMLIVADIINPEGDVDQEYQDDEPEIGYDAVKVYSYDRRHQLKGFSVNVSLDNPNDLEMGEDVKISIEAFDENAVVPPTLRQIFSGKLTQNNPSLTFSTNSNYFDIGKNSYQYFYRVHYNDKNPKVNWNVDYLYTDSGNLDGNSYHSEEILKLEDNFILSNNGSYPMKFTGNGTITWNSTSLPNPLADDLRIRAVKKTYNQNGELTNEQIIYNSPVINHSSTVIPSGNINFSTVFNYNQQTGEMSYDELEFKLLSITNLKWHEINLTPKITYSGSTNIGGVTETISGEKHIIPQHSIYHREYDAQGQPLNNPYARSMYLEETSLNNFTNIACVGLYTISNGYNFNEDIDGTIYITIKRNGQFFGRIIITITDGIVSLSGHPITLPPGHTYFVILSTNDDLDENTPGILNKFIEAHSANNYEFFKTCNGVVPIGNFISQVNFTYRGPNYIGGGQFFYNPELASTSTPVDPEGDKLIDVNALNVSSMANILYAILGVGSPEDYDTPEEYEQAILDALGLEEGEEIGIDEIDSYLDGNSTIEDLIEFLMSSQCILPAIPFREKEGNEYIDKWIGLHEDMYVDKTSARAGKFDVLNGPFNDTGIGDPEPEPYGPQQADMQTGMMSVSLYGTGRYKSKRKFIWSESSGENKYSTRFVDLNGDRYPEIIHNNEIYYTTMTGGQKNAVTSIMGSSPLEYIESNVKGISIARSFNSSDISNLSGDGDSGDQNNAVARVGLSWDDLSGDIKQEELWMDINGDGFTDWIRKVGNNYKIYYSIGQTIDSNAVNVNAGYTAPNISPAGSAGVSIGGGFGEILGQMGNTGISGMLDISLGGSFSQSDVKSQFVDINNDGLLDLVYEANSKLYVKYNLGNVFSSQQILGDTSLNGNLSLSEFAKDSSAAASITVGIVYAWNFMIWIIPAYVKAGGWMMFNGNVTASEVKKVFKDINGDGYVDLLLDREGGFQVYNSKMGQVNRLKSVNTSLGDGIVLNYIPIGNTYDMPINKWVLNNVTELKPNPSGNSIAINQFYEYKNGYYDRREREFYGFSIVKSYTSPKTLTQANSMGESAFRATIEAQTINKYYNKSYYLRGKPKEQYIIKGDYDGLNPETLATNRIHSKTQNLYMLKPSTEDGLINMSATNLPENYDVGGTEGRGTAAAILEKSVTKIYEYGNTPITTTTEYVFDGYNRLKTQKSVEENLVKEFYYPDQLLSDVSLSFMQEMTDAFRLNTVIKTITKEGDVALLTSQSDYDSSTDTNNQIRPVEQLSVKGSDDVNNLETIFTIDKYDDAGHIIQQSTPDGRITSVIWGYNDRYPVVTIEGLAYNQLPAAIVGQIRSISSSAPNDESSLLSKINELRTHTSVSGKALITAYTYYPNTGVRTVISSNGLKARYTYYPNGKLKEVIDNNGKVIQEFKYNYYDVDLND